eukprot:c8392_g1_i1.p1 GENE.c8392_g1_i1~~c8392_g1_i1.p1  ORF type:complete len:716 (+),score=338.71 c8392_g1_i1:55-2148(+)
MEVPKLDVSAAVLDRYAADLEKIKLDPATKNLANNASIPTFQRQGYMMKLGHTRKKWFKRFFVLRDSFLLSYNLDKSDLTVEPASAIHLGGCKVQEIAHGDKPYCIYIVTTEKDEFVFGLEADLDRKNWLKDFQISRTITHANMVKLSVENKCLAEEKGVAEVTKTLSASALSIFSNEQYVRKTPLIGGMEGWLFTPGFNQLHGKGGLFNKAKWTKYYFVLRDSHLLMFKSGDSFTKPRGCMYLIGTETEDLEVEDKTMFGFVCRSVLCGDLVELAAPSEKARARWVDALRIGARVTYRDFKLLLKEHELLAKVGVGATESDFTAAAEASSNEESSNLLAPASLGDDVDVQGQQLDPGVLQAYTKEGNPILRDPEGNLIDPMNGEVIAPTAERYAETGELLDAFNRPLPVGAVPMFTQSGVPIGVGPDGLHYLPDGTIIEKNVPHFDAQGRELPQNVVDAADSIADVIKVAIQVRSHLKGEGSSAEAVDVLGRTFRDLKEDAQGMVTNRDGQKVSVSTARVLDTQSTATNKMVDYKTFRQQNVQTHRQQGTVPVEERKAKITVRMEEDEGNFHEVGTIEVEGTATLTDVRSLIQKEGICEKEFVFLINSLPLMNFEESTKLVLALEGDVVIRPRKELTTTVKNYVPKNFSHDKWDEMTLYEEKKRREREEMERIMRRIREGTYLKPNVEPVAGGADE